MHFWCVSCWRDRSKIFKGTQDCAYIFFKVNKQTSAPMRHNNNNNGTHALLTMMWRHVSYSILICGKLFSNMFKYWILLEIICCWSMALSFLLFGFFCVRWMRITLHQYQCREAGTYLSSLCYRVNNYDDAKLFKILMSSVVWRV